MWRQEKDKSNEDTPKYVCGTGHAQSPRGTHRNPTSGTQGNTALGEPLILRTDPGSGMTAAEDATPTPQRFTMLGMKNTQIVTNQPNKAVKSFWDNVR